MFQGFEFIRPYMDDLLIITTGDWKYHPYKLEIILNKLKENKIKCNIEKVFIDKTKMGYLSFWVNQ